MVEEIKKAKKKIIIDGVIVIFDMSQHRLTLVIPSGMSGYAFKEWKKHNSIKYLQLKSSFKMLKEKIKLKNEKLWKNLEN